MHGLMQERSLDIGLLTRRVESLFGHKTVVTATLAGETSATWADITARARHLSAALDLLQVPREARVGTFAWNTQRHVELYMAVPSSGRVLHTLNHRLFSHDLSYIINDARDDVLFVDRSLLPTVWPLVDEAPTVRWVIVMDDGADAEIPSDPRVIDYEDLLTRAPTAVAPVELDEREAASLCYTSGTTGRPKGVLYSHRSVVLHALLLLGADSLALSERDVAMAIVPMFHVNAWGLPYGAMLTGSTLVLPGPAMTPASLANQIERHRVTLAAGVPAIWRSLTPLLATADLSSLRQVVSGGSALSDSLSTAWEEALGFPINSSWGMTETSPLVAFSHLATVHDSLDREQQRHILEMPGPNVPLTEVRIVDESGTRLPHDGITAGELQVAGPTIASAYFGSNPGTESFTTDGWLRTGDVATVDRYGYLRIVDRTKDMVKSGGEWISSVELENELMAHPDIVEAAVVGVPDDRWGERPIAFVVTAEAHDVTAADLREYLAGRVASWWIPDEFRIIPEIPKTATGKFSKMTLRKLINGRS